MILGRYKNTIIFKEIETFQQLLSQEDMHIQDAAHFKIYECANKQLHGL